jgi:gamma-glutamyl-gamma-aminobutyrate hydrolase PuuD
VGTEIPVIGVVSQTLESEMKNDTRFKDYNTYIMKSYVTWLEANGARVIPLINGEPETLTTYKLSKVNAVLFPGGDGDYLEYGRLIFNKIKAIND